MKVFLIRERSGIDAQGEFDPTTRAVTVLKGSKLSSTVTHTEKFKGSKSIETRRDGVLKDNVLQKNIEFKSASTAANFVTGSSTNGLITWKDKSGRTIKEILAESEVSQ